MLLEILKYERNTPSAGAGVLDPVPMDMKAQLDLHPPFRPVAASTTSIIPKLQSTLSSPESSTGSNLESSTGDSIVEATLPSTPIASTVQVQGTQEIFTPVPPVELNATPSSTQVPPSAQVPPLTPHQPPPTPLTSLPPLPPFLPPFFLDAATNPFDITTLAPTNPFDITTLATTYPFDITTPCCIPSPRTPDLAIL